MAVQVEVLHEQVMGLDRQLPLGAADRATALISLEDDARASTLAQVQHVGAVQARHGYLLLSQATMVVGASTVT